MTVYEGEWAIGVSWSKHVAAAQAIGGAAEVDPVLDEVERLSAHRSARYGPLRRPYATTPLPHPPRHHSGQIPALSRAIVQT
jgi:hypothetical protein